MEFEKRYAKLNTSQKRAVDTIEGPVIVIAGPGTGKTELLSVRTANILKQTDTLPQNILCLTFTDSGAQAMRERLIGIIGKDAYKVAIHTFHSFGSEVINQNREYFYRGASFTAADDISRYEILRKIFDQLDYKNPLAATMNGEYTHLKDTQVAISELKRSGLTSDELLSIIEQNEAAVDKAESILAPVISGTINKAMQGPLRASLSELEQDSSAKELFGIVPLGRVIIDDLSLALEQAESIHPTKPLTAWKNKWFEKDQNGRYVLRSRRYHEKLRALCYVYYEYLREMEQASLYDYDDMILQVVHAVEVNDDLRYNLQEKYLYVMVDEFQDTNLAQMRILRNLTNNPVNEGRPNILVVGDDDQAIYSFQGADIGNIQEFLDTYPSTSPIVLTDNYRSTPDILSQSRLVITQGVQRLENTLNELNKQLNSQSKARGGVTITASETIADERYALTQQVADAIRRGAKPQDIAVLTRRHHQIHSLLPYFAHAGIPVRYDQQDNVLDMPEIRTLELLARTVLSLSIGNHDDANGYLPELLAHPAWNIAPADLWRLSTTAYNNHHRWMDEMSSDPTWLPTHSWLIELASLAADMPLEQMLDRMIGRDASQQHSPFFDYYFSDDTLQQTPARYLNFLEALRTIRSKLAEYHPGSKNTLDAFVAFIDIHRKLNMPVMLTNSASDDAAVTLMTVHKSKGLEFKDVYIFNAVDSVWGEKVRRPSRLINYPENLQLAHAGDTLDERLRLFYVAMTRAKEQLHISYSKTDDHGRSTLIASFLSDSDIEVKTFSVPKDVAVTAAELAWYKPLVAPDVSLKKLLAPQLQSYKLSPTHLNAFLDVTNKGPQGFLLNNLLHFPSAKSPAASYGSAVHTTLQQAQTHVAETGSIKPLEDILHDYEINLKRQRLDKLDYETFLQKGSEQLHTFINNRADLFTPTGKAELSFDRQEVIIGAAHLTGIIDLAIIDHKHKSMTVIDYKTGKPLESWRGSTDYEKVKAYKYRQQLMFYKLLVERSRDYGAFTVGTGALEFIEPTKAGKSISLELNYEDSELDRLQALIDIVWDHIVRLDLPDVTTYDNSIKGILAFEQDLLDGKL